ncbi:AMP-binding enzyme [Peptostreptococcaceae bacterium oral taxon 113 str. W5053]|nr:AMP-binding enzyme [Peptostreptococcaceae bacterium oral taxon 113 str. W5053]
MPNNWIGNYLYSRAQLSPNKVAVVDLDEGKEYSYVQLEHRANQLAQVLKEDFKVKPKDRVAFLSRNRIELIDGYYATGKIGAIMVPYNARLSSQELGILIDKEEPKVIFYEDIYENSIQEVLQERSGIEAVMMKNGDLTKNCVALEYSALLNSKDGSGQSYENGELEDIHLIIHTGGTTGLPKGGLISHRSELFNSFNEICTWGLRYTDSAVLLLPMFHTGGWNLLTLPLLHVGGTIFINRQYDPKLTLKIIEERRTTVLFGAATIFRMMTETEEFSKADLSSLRWVMAGAAPTPIHIMKQFWDKGIKFVLGYGMTEAGPNNLSVPAQFVVHKTIQEKYESVGKPMYLSMAKLVDEEGVTIDKDDELGELLWAGPQIFSGYWANEEATEHTLIDGWVHTGDMAKRDKDGFYYIVGRKKNMYISGGENVFPPEVETAIYDIEGVNEVCVFGVADERWGEVGKAVISLKDGAVLDKASILDKLTHCLAKYKVPKYITFVQDVPKNNVGKIVVKQVMELYGDAHD